MATTFGCVHPDAQPLPETGAAGAGTAEVAAVAPGVLPHPFLWRLTKGDKITYLLGTVHVGVDPVKELPPSVWQTFAKAKCFAMEADQEHIDRKAVLKMATLPAGQSLRKMVGEASWKTLTADLKDQVSARDLDHLAPWFVSLLYVQRGAPDGAPMDTVIGSRARAEGKQLVYLETWREALSAFRSITTVADLQDLIGGGDEVDDETAEMVAAYRQGDEKAVVAAIAAAMSETPDAAHKMKILLDGRNKAWLPKLAQLAQTGGCFVAVGTAHLVGPGNLRDLLAAQGYRSERVALP